MFFCTSNSLLRISSCQHILAYSEALCAVTLSKHPTFLSCLGQLQIHQPFFNQIRFSDFRAQSINPVYRYWKYVSRYDIFCLRTAIHRNTGFIEQSLKKSPVLFNSCRILNYHLTFILKINWLVCFTQCLDLTFNKNPKYLKTLDKYSIFPFWIFWVKTI